MSKEDLVTRVAEAMRASIMQQQNELWCRETDPASFLGVDGNINLLELAMAAIAAIEADRQ